MKHAVKDIFSNHPVKRTEEDLFTVKKVPYKKNDLWLLEKLMRQSSYSKKGNTGSYSKAVAKYTDGWQNDKDQRVMFKMSYSPNFTVHQKYLNTYMPQENKASVLDKPELFGTPEDEYNENMAALHFKCIISPENQEVDLQLLSREFIKRMEAMTGYQFYWRGCIHKDTGHRHAHLCINGIDKQGKKVRFPKGMIKTTMRETLSYVTTQMIGERSDKEIQAAKKGLVNAMRWTKLDEELETYGEKISFHNLSSELANRLLFLREMRLVEKHDRYYTLKYDWKDVLVSSGRYNTFLSEWQKADGKLELYSGGEVHGICENVITFDKDEAWNDAVIIRNGEKKIYVPIWQLKKENLVGKEVFISGGNRALSRQIKDSDIHIINDEIKQKLSENENEIE